MSEALKPCPFCGEDGELTHANDGSYWYVDCTYEMCPVQPSTGKEHTEAKAIAAWNTRTTDAALLASHKKLVEALKGLFIRHSDGSEEKYWGEWDTADAVLREAEKVEE